jgi:hypothetical protein
VGCVAFSAGVLVNKEKEKRRVKTVKVEKKEKDFEPIHGSDGTGKDFADFQVRDLVNANFESFPVLLHHVRQFYLLPEKERKK